MRVARQFIVVSLTSLSVFGCTPGAPENPNAVLGRTTTTGDSVLRFIFGDPRITDGAVLAVPVDSVNSFLRRADLGVSAERAQRLRQVYKRRPEAALIVVSHRAAASVGGEVAVIRDNGTFSFMELSDGGYWLCRVGSLRPQLAVQGCGEVRISVPGVVWLSDGQRGPEVWVQE